MREPGSCLKGVVWRDEVPPIIDTFCRSAAVLPQLSDRKRILLFRANILCTVGVRGRLCRPRKKLAVVRRGFAAPHHSQCAACSCLAQKKDFVRGKCPLTRSFSDRP